MDDMKYVATVLFVLAVLHTFSVKRFARLAHRYPEGSIGENLFHFLGEVEVVFGLWAAVLIGIWSVRFGTESAAQYLDGVNYTEAVFVFVIMCMAATRPILYLSERSIEGIARLVPIPGRMALYVTCLTIGPLLGSFITEPAAMTVTALLLRDKFYRTPMSLRFRYATLGLLFVNISIGGVLTNFAAPPILMVAGSWNWSSAFMAATFGWKAALAISVGSVATALVFRKELLAPLAEKQASSPHNAVPAWVVGVHVAFMGLTILTAHHMSFFLPLFLLFLGWHTVAREYQDELRVKESLLVGFFLGGLVTLGKLQEWWIQPLVGSLDAQPLFWGATVLTAFTDNAALTYLGTLVPNLADAAKYALAAGAVTGGGLTVIANAPNPAGYGLLREGFGEHGISPLGLALGALPYTLLAALAFLLL